MISVIRAEFSKINKLNFLWGIILLASALRLWQASIPSYHEYPYSPYVYQQYTTKLEGKLTDEKVQYLNDRYEEIVELLEVYSSMVEAYENGKIDLQTFSEFNEKHGIALAEEKTVAYLCEKVAVLQECSDFEKNIFYDTDWEDLFLDNTYDFILLIAVLCIAVPVFEREFASGNDRFLLTSKKGKTTLCAAKLIVTMGSVGILSLLSGGMRLLVFGRRVGFRYRDMAVGNIKLCDGYGDTTLLQYFLRDAGLKALVVMLLSVGICLIAVCCRNVSFTVVGAFLLMTMPFGVSYVREGAAREYLLSSVLLRTMYPPNLRIPLLVVVLLAKTLIISACVVLVWNRKRDGK